MKRQTVGVLLVQGGQVLLTRRAQDDRYPECLWSLPLGDAGEAETHHITLARILANSKGLNFYDSHGTFQYERETADTTLYLISAADRTIISQGSTIQEFGFFSIDDLPERIHIESLFYIIKYKISTSSLNEHPSYIIDRVFASIFYSYLAPSFSSLCDISEIEVYKYIVLSTPYRKFKSVVPFLISECSREARRLFLIPELCFAVWTLLDDCYDDTLYRYGRESALQKFGKSASVAALFTCLCRMCNLFAANLSQKNANKITAALSHSADMLLQRSSNDLEIDIDTYLDQSAARTKFLRVAWVSLLEQIGYKKEKLELLYEVQKRSAKIGQLINDYFDIERGQLQDFDRKVASVHWLLLKHEAKGSDKSLLRALWLGTEGGREQYHALLKKYKIREVLRNKIRDGLVSIIRCIQQMPLDEEEKIVLIAWHQMSFVQFNQDVNDQQFLEPFLRVVERGLNKW